jgi:hypothetical protein
MDPSWDLVERTKIGNDYKAEMNAHFRIELAQSYPNIGSREPAPATTSTPSDGKTSSPGRL